MTVGLLAPLLIASVLAAAVASVHRRLPPRLATRSTTIALVTVTVAGTSTAATIALVYLAHVPLIGAGAAWCLKAIGLHGTVSPWVGAPLLVASVWSAVRVTRVIIEHRRWVTHAGEGLELVDSAVPCAVTLPGRAGRIVVSRGLLDMLDEHEQRAVIEHERSHARHRHDRYLIVASLATAALPLVQPIARLVRYSIERWADDDAARACGDRRLVATTLGKVALLPSPATLAGFTGSGVAARMAALLEPPVRRPTTSMVLSVWCAVFASGVSAATQLHHLQPLVAALCPH